MKKRILSMLLAACLVFSLLPATARAAEIVHSGTCGTNPAWTLDDTGVLTISGLGPMEDYGYHMAPWSSYYNSITVNIEPGVTSIGNSAFSGCTGLTSVTIPNSVTTIGSDAFRGCHSLTSITIPSGVTSIGDAAFSACTSLSSITIPDSVTSIGEPVFMGCSSLTSIVVDGANSQYSSTDGVLFSKDKAKLIRCPEGKSSYTIPNSVTSIEDHAFDSCTRLTRVIIPSSVTSIGSLAFGDCHSLSSVVFLGFLPPTISNSCFCNNVGIEPWPCTFHYPYGSTGWDTTDSYGAEFTVTWLAYGPTELTTSTTEISADDEAPTVVIASSNLPFDATEGEKPANYTITGGSFNVTAAEISETDDKMVTLTLENTGGAASRASDVSVEVAAAAFAAELTDANATPVTSASVSIPLSGGSTTDPGTTGPTTPTTPTYPSYTPTPAPAPSANPEGDLTPGTDLIPPPVPEPPVSPIQGVVKDETGIRDWIDRIEPPEYAKTLYDTLVDGSGGGSGGTPPYLVEDQYFTLPPDSSAADGQEVLYVECVDFDLADLYAGQNISLGAAVFEDEDFFHVPDSGARVNYAALEMGDAVKTASFNGVFITSIAKTATFDVDKKSMASYVSTVFQAFDRDHPEVFWLNGKCRVRIPVVRAADGTEQAYFFLALTDNTGFTMRSPDWDKDGAVAAGIKRREAAIETILDTVTAEAPAEIVRQLNRWLTEHNQYNTTPDLTTIGNEPHECLSALEGRIGRDGPVCDGYSRAFKTLCDRLNIPCILENGYAKTSSDSKGTFHMWNAVEIGGQWYGVDVTWNDPTVKGFVGAKSGKENEQFLLVGQGTIVRGMTFAASHPANNKASVDGVAFDNGPALSGAAFSAVTANAGLAALPFDDVPEGVWYYDHVAYVYNWNLMMGTGANKFSPDGITTRQQLWMILARMDGKQPRSMEAAREWAMKAGVSDGKNPGGQLTREQLVTMLYRYCEAKGYDVSAGASLSGFTDAGAVSDWAAQAMGWAVAKGIINGVGNSTIAPQGTATRVQMATMVTRLCAKKQA